MFQAPNLLPWLTARENVQVGVDRFTGTLSAGQRRDITEYYLARVGLSAALDKRASDLSNGMKQRVGLARAFALSPSCCCSMSPSECSTRSRAGSCRKC